MYSKTDGTALYSMFGSNTVEVVMPRGTGTRPSSNLVFFGEVSVVFGVGELESALVGLLGFMDNGLPSGPRSSSGISGIRLPLDFFTKSLTFEDAMAGSTRSHAKI